MRRGRWLIAFLWMLVMTLSVEGAIHKKIFILHSYSQEYEWTKLQHHAFVDTLQTNRASTLEFSTEYLDTKRMAMSASYETFFADYLRKKYAGYIPDVIYVSDDNALKFFLDLKAPLFAGVPIFFSGINNPDLPKNTHKMHLSGVFEQKEIEPNIELIRQFSPQTHDIWFVGDGSETYRAIESDIRHKALQYVNYRFHYVVSENIDDILEQLPKKPRTFVVLTTIGALQNAQGEKLMIAEAIATLRRKNPSLILCSMEDAYITGGVVGGFVTSGSEQGSATAKLVARYLNGASMDSIAPIVKSPNVYMFDHNALVDARLVLSEYIARNAIILHGEQTFFERYSNEILSFIFTIMVAMALALAVALFMNIDLKRKINLLKQKSDRSSVELHTIRRRITFEEEAFGAGYWEWDMVSEEISLSEGIKSIMGLVNDSGYKMVELIGMVHPKDRKNVEEAIEKVLTSHTPIVIEHKIVSTNEKVYTVHHSLCYRIDTVGEKGKIVGMVLVENE